MKVYQCEKCKKTIITKDEVKLEGWVELIPCSTDAAQEKHVPTVTKKCKQVKVDVGSVAHPMSEEHFIEWVAIETAQGYQVKYLKAGELPVCSFSLADGDTLVKVYAYCNLHGLWSN
ncbi:MAG: desulfoferrodoxin Dfx [Clostridia bacterium]|nr:desulfoferrodoxin Dfx [Clostridia bacterium]